MANILLGDTRTPAALSSGTALAMSASARIISSNARKDVYIHLRV